MHLTLSPARLLAFTLAAAAGSLSAQTAAAPASRDETIELPKFNVSAQAADPYLPNETMSVARVAGSILDAPFSVNVVTQDLINDLGATAAFDATRYFSGVSPGRGTGAGGLMDRQTFRGFESFSKTIDDFSSFLLPTGSGFQANFDPVFIERAELVMGPDSILSPTGTPGGSINIITKSPQFNRGTDLTAEVGNYNAEKATVDTTGPIGSGGHWAYRVIGSAQDAQTYVPGRLKQYNGSVQLEYAFSSSAKITFKYFGEQWTEYGPVADANENGEQVYMPNTVNGATLPNDPQPGFTYQGANGDASWSKRMDRLNIGELEFTSPLGEHVTMRLGAEVLFDNETQDFAYPRVAPGEIFDQNTGQEIGVTAINPAALPEIGLYSHAIDRELQLQNDYAGRFHPGPVSLQPVVGWSLQDGSQPTFYTIDDTSSTDLPAANAAAGSYSPAHPPLANYTTFGNNGPENAKLFQGYGLLRAGFFSDRVFLTGGVSRTWASVNDYTFKGVYVPGVGQVGASPATAGYLQDFTFQNTGNALAPTQRDSHDSYIGGVLVKPLPNLSLYTSYSTNAGIAANSPLWQAGSQIEFGAKLQFFDQRLQVTASHFQIRQSNISAPNPLFNLGLSGNPTFLTDETNHGEEVDIVGSLTRNLSVIASATEMKLRDPFGRRVRNIPDTMANLLLKYRFTGGSLDRLSVFAGVIHMGNTAGETVSGLTQSGIPEQPGFYIAPSTVLNAGAGYQLGRYHFGLNVDNVLNSHFWWQPAGRISVSPYPGATFRFTTAVHF